MPVEGIGGIFFRARDPKALGAWYEQHFGLKNGGPTFFAQGGPAVFSTFPEETDYFGGAQSFMINLGVSGLDGLLRDLKAAGVDEVKPQETMAGVGRFAWVEDPEGNRVELWEAADAP